VQRVILGELREALGARESFCIETNLAGRGLVRRMSEWRGRGYKLHLVFTALDSPDLALQRVAFRVALGGHDVPEAVVRQRWAAGLRSLFDVYLPIVDRYSMQTGGTDFSGWPPRLALQRLGRVESSSTPLPRSTMIGSPSPRRRSTSR
jgi:predicted ABC-type ATPase